MHDMQSRPDPMIYTDLRKEFIEIEETLADLCKKGELTEVQLVQLDSQIFKILDVLDILIALGGKEN